MTQLEVPGGWGGNPFRGKWQLKELEKNCVFNASKLRLLLAVVLEKGEMKSRSWQVVRGWVKGPVFVFRDFSKPFIGNLKECE